MRGSPKNFGIHSRHLHHRGRQLWIRQFYLFFIACAFALFTPDHISLLHVQISTLTPLLPVAVMTPVQNAAVRPRSVSTAIDI